jgi:carboxymethylenebutenolidase
VGDFIGLEGGGRAYVSEPSSQATGGVVVFHAWWGLTAVFEEVCDGLAASGFLALCPDLYGGRTASTIQDAQGLLEADQSTARTKLALRAADAVSVRAQPVAALGFSMGGDYALWAATQRSEITKVVTFYGGSEQDADFPTTITAEIQGHFAADDEWESADAARDLEARLEAAGRVA